MVFGFQLVDLFERETKCRAEVKQSLNWGTDKLLSLIPSVAVEGVGSLTFAGSFNEAPSLFAYYVRANKIEPRTLLL